MNTVYDAIIIGGGIVGISIAYHLALDGSKTLLFDRRDIGKATDAAHLRKGIVGDWRNYFTEEQNKRFNRLYCRKMSGSNFKNYWDESILGITPPIRPYKV